MLAFNPQRWVLAVAMASCIAPAIAVGANAGAGRVLPSVVARAAPAAVARDPQLPADDALRSSQATIGEIRYEARDVFDIGAGDENTSLSRLANRLHISTRQGVIANQVLFRSGEPYTPRLLEESARILRDTRYLRDAQVRPLAFHDGVVDVEVTTQDVWTLNPGVSFGRTGGANTSGFEIEELNLLGLGTQIGFGFSSGVDRDSTSVFYRDRQLGSSWWDLSARYSDNSDGRLGEAAIEHPFYALDSRWAAGVALRADQRIDSRYALGEIVDRYGVRQQHATAYWGRSDGLREGWARRLTVGLTFDEQQFDTAPAIALVGPMPQDRRLLYPWLGAEWVQDEFHTTRNRDQIEKTEDYSLGWRARGQLGFATPSLGSDRSAFVLAATASNGLALSDRQSLLINGSLTGRVEGGRVAGGLLDTQVRYYFRQSSRRLFFMSMAAQLGSNLDLDQQIVLGGDGGLRGYPLRYQAGSRRWLFTAEQRLFSDWYPFQLFNVGGAVFYDMGATSGKDPLGTPSLGVLKDVGVGLRLGNSRSGLGNVLHVDLAVPLDGDSSIRRVQLLVQTKRQF